MGRPIPEIRRDLYALATEMEIAGDDDLADRLRALADDTYRNAPCRRTPVVSDKLTAKKARAIRSYASAHPSMSQQDIGNVFNVNAGRVSQSLNYKI